MNSKVDKFATRLNFFTPENQFSNDGENWWTPPPLPPVPDDGLAKIRLLLHDLSDKNYPVIATSKALGLTNSDIVAISAGTFTGTISDATYAGAQKLAAQQSIRFDAPNYRYTAPTDAAQKLKLYREAVGKSAAEMDDLLKLGKTQYGRQENGNRPVRQATWDKVTEYFNRNDLPINVVVPERAKDQLIQMRNAAKLTNAELAQLLRIEESILAGWVAGRTPIPPAGWHAIVNLAFKNQFTIQPTVPSYALDEITNYLNKNNYEKSELSVELGLEKGKIADWYYNETVPLPGWIAFQKLAFTDSFSDVPPMPSNAAAVEYINNLLPNIGLNTKQFEEAVGLRPGIVYEWRSAQSGAAIGKIRTNITQADWDKISHFITNEKAAIIFVAPPNAPEIMKSVRENAGLNTNDVSKLMGVNSNTIEQWENGRTSISNEVWAKFTQLIFGRSIIMKPIVPDKAKEQIKFLRENNNLNLKDFAAIIGTSAASVDDWESGKHEISVPNWLKILNAIYVKKSLKNVWGIPNNTNNIIASELQRAGYTFEDGLKLLKIDVNDFKKWDSNSDELRLASWNSYSAAMAQSNIAMRFAPPENAGTLILDVMNKGNWSELDFATHLKVSLDDLKNWQTNSASVPYSVWARFIQSVYNNDFYLKLNVPPNAADEFIAWKKRTGKNSEELAEIFDIDVKNIQKIENKTEAVPQWFWNLFVKVRLQGLVKSSILVPKEAPDELIRIRELMKMKPAQFAEALGVSVSDLEDWEDGKKQIPITEWINFQKLLMNGKFVASIEIPKNAGNELLRIRTLANLSQEEMANKLGIPYADTIDRYETGAMSVPKNIWYKLQIMLGNNRFTARIPVQAGVPSTTRTVTIEESEPTKIASNVEKPTTTAPIAEDPVEVKPQSWDVEVVLPGGTRYKLNSPVTGNSPNEIAQNLMRRTVGYVDALQERPTFVVTQKVNGAANSFTIEAGPDTYGAAMAAWHNFAGTARAPVLSNLQTAKIPQKWIIYDPSTRQEISKVTTPTPVDMQIKIEQLIKDEKIKTNSISVVLEGEPDTRNKIQLDGDLNESVIRLWNKYSGHLSIVPTDKITEMRYQKERAKEKGLTLLRRTGNYNYMFFRSDHGLQFSVASNLPNAPVINDVVQHIETHLQPNPDKPKHTVFPEKVLFRNTVYNLHDGDLFKFLDQLWVNKTEPGAPVYRAVYLNAALSNPAVLYDFQVTDVTDAAAPKTIYVRMVFKISDDGNVINAYPLTDETVRQTLKQSRVFRINPEPPVSPPPTGRAEDNANYRTVTPVKEQKDPFRNTDGTPWFPISDDFMANPIDPEDVARTVLPEPGSWPTQAETHEVTTTHVVSSHTEVEVRAGVVQVADRQTFRSVLDPTVKVSESDLIMRQKAIIEFYKTNNSLLLNVPRQIQQMVLLDTPISLDTPLTNGLLWVPVARFPVQAQNFEVETHNVTTQKPISSVTATAGYDSVGSELIEQYLKNQNINSEVTYENGNISIKPLNGATVSDIRAALGLTADQGVVDNLPIKGQAGQTQVELTVPTADVTVVAKTEAQLEVTQAQKMVQKLETEQAQMDTKVDKLRQQWTQQYRSEQAWLRGSDDALPTAPSASTDDPGFNPGITNPKVRAARDALRLPGEGSSPSTDATPPTAPSNEESSGVNLTPMAKFKTNARTTFQVVDKEVNEKGVMAAAADNYIASVSFLIDAQKERIAGNNEKANKAQEISDYYMEKATMLLGTKLIIDIGAKVAGNLSPTVSVYYKAAAASIEMMTTWKDYTQGRATLTKLSATFTACTTEIGITATTQSGLAGEAARAALVWTLRQSITNPADQPNYGLITELVMANAQGKGGGQRVFVQLLGEDTSKDIEQRWEALKAGKINP